MAKTRQDVIDAILTRIEALLDASDLTGEEVEMVLDCLKVKYKSGP